MSYIGANAQSRTTVADIDVYEHDGLSQQNLITGNITINTSENRAYFGDTTFTGNSIIVKGQMIIAGGSPNFSGGDINITGTLYAY